MRWNVLALPFLTRSTMAVAIDCSADEDVVYVELADVVDSVCQDCVRYAALEVGTGPFNPNCPWECCVCSWGRVERCLVVFCSEIEETDELAFEGTQSSLCLLNVRNGPAFTMQLRTLSTCYAMQLRIASDRWRRCDRCMASDWCDWCMPSDWCDRCMWCTSHALCTLVNRVVMRCASIEELGKRKKSRSPPFKGVDLYSGPVSCDDQEALQLEWSWWLPNGGLALFVEEAAADTCRWCWSALWRREREVAP